MAPQKHPSRSAAWTLARQQHGVVSRSQLLSLGLSGDAIRHRIAVGRLHPLWRGVYAVGRPTVSQRGRWMAAVLSCGAGALLSHRSAAGLWGVLRPFPELEVTVPRWRVPRRPGIVVHRRSDHGADQRRVIDGIPVTDIVTTLVDLGSCATQAQLLRAINQADRRDLIDASSLRVAIESHSRRPGLVRLRALLDESGFSLPETLLEQRFLRIVRAAGLPAPECQARVNGYRADFYWPAWKLVVETDGGLDHRTPAQQGKDRRRDQKHAAAGFTPLRFTEAQVRYEPEEVRDTLLAVVDRLRRADDART
jgi:very-short-patch-repair endonuclease